MKHRFNLLSTITTGILAMLLVILCMDAKAQDCKLHFEASAGPDISVCETGTVQLHGIMGGDATSATWTGGKGTFTPSRNLLETEYTPAEEEIGKTVVLTLETSNPKSKCPAATSAIKIPVNMQPKVVAGNNQRVCAGKAVQLKPTLTGKAKQLTWSTTGSGSFSDAHKLDAAYTPSAEDISKGACSVKLVAEPFGVCMPDSSALVISFVALPQFETETAKKTSGKQPVKLGMKNLQNGKIITWATSGNGTFSNVTEANTVYTPSDDDVKKGTVDIYATLSADIDDCLAIKKIILTCSTSTK